jgi:transcriptional regulator with XRE-family HTH domain
MKRDTRKVVIDNIQMLMSIAGDSQHALAKKLGWKQSTISNILSGRHNISIEKADAIAQAYGLEGWHLLLRGLPRDLHESETISALFTNYLKSSSTGRTNINRVAEMEARYTDPEGNGNPTGTEG